MTHGPPPRRVWGRGTRATRGCSARTWGGSSANRTGTRTTPPTIFTKPCIGYWMPKGKTVEE